MDPSEGAWMGRFWEQQRNTQTPDWKSCSEGKLRAAGYILTLTICSCSSKAVWGKKGNWWYYSQNNHKCKKGLTITAVSLNTKQLLDSFQESGGLIYDRNLWNRYIFKQNSASGANWSPKTQTVRQGNNCFYPFKTRHSLIPIVREWFWHIFKINSKT